MLTDKTVCPQNAPAAPICVRKLWHKPELVLLPIAHTAKSHGHCNGRQDRCAS